MNKRLGQHFLINKSAIQKIISSLDLQKGDVVIEIGPGEGALTLPLMEKCEKIGCKIIAIEKDPCLAKRIGENVQLSMTNFQTIQGDVLKELPGIAKRFLAGQATLTADRFKVVGNIPYYITGKLLRTISELKTKPELTILMIQKEVAERIAAKPPRMNLLAAAVQFWAKPEILFTLKPSDFNPPPKVSSAVIRLSPHAQKNRKAEKLKNEDYYRFIKVLFKQPRKTILNNLRVSGINKEQLKKLKIDPQDRPQNLSVEQIKQLTELFTF